MVEYSRACVSFLLMMINKFKKLARRAVDRIRSVRQKSREYRAFRSLRLRVDASLAKPPSRVALIGCGHMGQAAANAVGLLPGWTITALCDSRQASMDALAVRLAPSASRHTSAESLFAARESFDILVIATTAPGHVPLALAAIAAGVRAILVEKPVATSVEDARRLAAAAAAAGARVAVDHTRRWVVAGDGIARLLALGVIGRPVSVYCAPGRGGFSMIGTHGFDFLRWILADEPARVRAEFDAEQVPSHRGADFSDRSGRCEVEFRGGVRAVVDLGSRHLRPHGLTLVMGDAGRLEIDDKAGTVRLHGASGFVHELDHPWPGGQGPGVAAALAELAGKSPVSCTVDDGARALEVAVAANHSARSGGGWVDLPLSRELAAERFAFP